MVTLTTYSRDVMGLESDDGEPIMLQLAHMPEHMKAKLLPVLHGCMARSSNSVLRVVDTLKETVEGRTPEFECLHFDTYYRMGSSVSYQKQHHTLQTLNVHRERMLLKTSIPIS